MTSEALHLLGAAVGFGLGIIMLKKGWVDCENWDLLSVLAGRHRAADQQHAIRVVFEGEGDLAVEPVLAQGIDRDGRKPPRAGVDARRHDAEREIGTRRTDPQAVGILRAAPVLGIAQTHAVGPVGRQREADQRIGVVRVQRVGLPAVLLVDHEEAGEAPGAVAALPAEIVQPPLCFHPEVAPEWSIACIKSLESGWVHPTINYQHPDPQCDLDYVPNQARRVDPCVALSNSFGFGGHNGCVIFRRWEAAA